MPTEKYGRLVNFIPEQFRSGALASPAAPPNGFVQARNAKNPLPGVPLVADSLVPNDKNNFAPRVASLTGLGVHPYGLGRRRARREAERGRRGSHVRLGRRPQHGLRSVPLVDVSVHRANEHLRATEERAPITKERVRLTS
jgi:hypothetical protein